MATSSAVRQGDELQSPLHVSVWKEGAGLDRIFLEEKVKLFPGQL